MRAGYTSQEQGIQFVIAGSTDKVFFLSGHWREYSMLRQYSVLVASLLLLWSSIAAAVEVMERLPNGLEASAEFIQGQRDKPAVLILHGFLQMRNTATVSNLVNNLSSDGYTLLAPALSLGVSRRKQSLPCETPHPHTFSDDVTEVGFWVDWLATRHNATSIILIGHSTGNAQLLAYASEHRAGLIKKIIAISLVEYEREFGGKHNQTQYKQAQRRAQKGDNSLGKYKLSYCNNYVAPAAAFLSYASWNEDKIVSTLQAIKFPVIVLVGEADARMRPVWRSRLIKASVVVKSVQGANHFFSDTHEFDLYDQVTQAIRE